MRVNPLSTYNMMNTLPLHGGKQKELPPIEHSKSKDGIVQPTAAIEMVRQNLGALGNNFDVEA